MAIRASAAACEITPEGAVPLTGFPQIRRTSTGVRDPLLVSAVHLRSGSGGIVILSLDLFSLDPSYVEIIRRRISAAIGLREDFIFVTTTQNHAGPPAGHAFYLHHEQDLTDPNPDYINMVVGQSVRAASEAAVASCPSSVAAFALDRPGTGAIIVKANNGRLLGAVVIYDELPDHLGPTNTEVSSDFLHVFREKLAARFGGSPVIAYVVAPSGERILDDQRSFGAHNAIKAGETLAGLIVSKVKNLTASDFASNIALHGKLSDVPGPARRELPSLMEASALMTAALDMNTSLQGKNSDPAQRKAAAWAAIEAGRTMNFIMAQQKGQLAGIMDEYKRLYFHLLQIDKMKVLGMPGKIVSSCGERIAAKAGANVLIAECVNGDLQGSILSCDADAPDSCKLMSCLFEQESGNTLVSQALSLFEQQA